MRQRALAVVADSGLTLGERDPGCLEDLPILERLAGLTARRRVLGDFLWFVMRSGDIGVVRQIIVAGERRIRGGMDRAALFLGIDFGEAGWIAAGSSTRRVEQRLDARLGLGILEEIVEQKRGEASASIQPLPRIAPYQTRAQPGVALDAVVGRAAA